jgi:hypothetical protein
MAGRFLAVMGATTAATISKNSKNWAGGGVVSTEDYSASKQTSAGLTRNLQERHGYQKNLT